MGKDPVGKVSVGKGPVEDRAAAWSGKTDPPRVTTPNPKVMTSDQVWESPGAVASLGEPVVNRLRGTTGSPGVAERG